MSAADADDAANTFRPVSIASSSPFDVLVPFVDEQCLVFLTGVEVINQSNDAFNAGVSRFAELEKHSLVLGTPQERGFGIAAEQNGEVVRHVEANRITEPTMQTQKVREAEWIVIWKMHNAEAALDV